MTEPKIPSLTDFEDAEHCVLEDLTVEHQVLPDTLAAPGSEPREISEEIEIRDRVRGRRTVVRIYAEGWADIEFGNRAKATRHHRLDLRYFDPMPAIQHYSPRRVLRAAGIAAGITALIAIPAIFGLFRPITVPTASVAAVVTFGFLFLTYYLTHEKIVFYTLNGRAPAIRFGAGLGTIRRFRKLVPRLVEAINETADTVGDSTDVFLRSEMREHYRLRSDGILTEAECAESTGRILGQFDGPL